MQFPKGISDALHANFAAAAACAHCWLACIVLILIGSKTNSRETNSRGGAVAAIGRIGLWSAAAMLPLIIDLACRAAALLNNPAHALHKGRTRIAYALHILCLFLRSVFIINL